MPPLAPPNPDSLNLPLADYFFIAGIESSQVYDEKAHANGGGLDAMIEEDSPIDGNENIRPTTPADLASAERRRSARMSWEARKSIGSMIGTESKGIASNRSSATIKAIQVFSTANLSEADFDDALRKFAAERDSFVDDLSFNAGTATPPKTPVLKPRPRAQKVVQEDRDTNNLRSSVGSIRRRLSTMSSMKRSPSVNRQSSIRTSKRLSGYNSVIPQPAPFVPSPKMHPLTRRYEPVLLDRYPPKNEVDALKQRNPFPDYVPMFAFPNDVTVASSDEKPRPTWHGFAMTNGDNSKLYGICITVWKPLDSAASEGLERQCEEWRKANMTDEQRELAGSLGERLATERAKLSALLAQLPETASDSEEREQLEDLISEVEERIGMMTEMLRPLRHATSSRIEGLTDGETGFWIPRTYGILGREGNMTGFWKEWLRAIVVPMTQGGILRVPPTSPRIGMWQPLERYVVNLCTEAVSPLSSLTQVEVAVRELRLYARKEALNELPGSRNVDLYALFRSLDLQNIMLLFEYALSESRIIFTSEHTAMLHLASQALLSLLYPIKWAGVLIPVLPLRLIQALDAPCPYIVGIAKSYGDVEIPAEDCVLVDLDCNTIGSTAPPTALPRQQRRKLLSLLQLAAPHHNRYGVPTGPPAYAQEAFPYDAFASENTSNFTSKAPASTLSTYVNLTSSSFGTSMPVSGPRNLIFNAFLQSRGEHGRGSERPGTGATAKTNVSPPSPKSTSSPTSATFSQSPTTPVSRSDSAYSLQAGLREKRSGHFDSASRRSSSFTYDRLPTLRRPSAPMPNVPPIPAQYGHNSSYSTSSLGMSSSSAVSSYAPSVYAQSTLAASTVMPNILMQPVRNTANTQWVEGHCLNWRPNDATSTCSVCDEKSDDGFYRCAGCGMFAHARCAPQICLVCPTAFRADQIRAAFVRCFASLFYTYRKFLQPANSAQKKSGLIYSFNAEGFKRSVPQDTAEYVAMLLETQGFNEFIHERETKRGDNPQIRLFDEIILSKKNRGKSSFFGRSNTDFLSDKSDHLWQSAAVNSPNARIPGDYQSIIARMPAKLDATLMKEPRVIQGAPRASIIKAKRKPIPSMLGQFGQTL